jgi:hypothetical protein
MASFLFTSALEDWAKGNIDWDTDTFKGKLVTDAYTPNKGTHTKRSNVTNEITGTGYTAGGTTVTVTVTKTTSPTHSLTLTFGAVSWPSSTLAARALVIYKSRGGADTADELVLYNDFGATITSTGGTFAVDASTYVIPN